MAGRRSERLILAALVLATPGLLAIGGAWDAHWHWTVGRDSMWIPPHLLLYTGILLNVALGALMLGGGRRDPGAWLIASGMGTVFTAAVFDLVWHATIGDRMVWSPPHVLFVFGGLQLGMGLVAGFVRARRLGIIGAEMSEWGVRLIAAGILVAAIFGQLPTAAMVFNPEVRDPTLLFVPSAVTLLTLLSGVMPGAFALALRAVGVAAFPRLITTTLGFWGLQQLFHLVLTPPLAASLGFAGKDLPLLTAPFELAIVAVALGPLVVIGPRFDRQPELAGAVAGAFYALAVQVGLNLTQGAGALSASTVVYPVILGSVSASAGSWLGAWIWPLAGLHPRSKPHPS